MIALIIIIYYREYYSQIKKKQNKININYIYMYTCMYMHINIYIINSTNVSGYT